MHGKHLHELRDLFRTRWHKSAADPVVAEFLMGHQVDPLGYNKAMKDEGYTKIEYLKALPWLNILSEDPSKVPRELHERQQLVIQDQTRKMDQMERRLRLMEEVLEISEEARKRNPVSQ